MVIFNLLNAFALVGGLVIFLTVPYDLLEISYSACIYHASYIVGASRNAQLFSFMHRVIFSSVRRSYDYSEGCVLAWCM